MAYIYIIATFFVAVGLASLLIPNVLFISYKKRLFDLPDARKVHTRPIPRLGGLTFFPVILVAFCLTMGARYLLGFPLSLVVSEMVFPQFAFFAAGITLLYLVGVADDLVGVGYRYKFVVQVLAASLMTVSGEYIRSLSGFFGISDLPVWLGVLFTIFLTVYITNAVNLIDGIDGLASGLSCVAFGVLGMINFHYGLYVYSILAFAALGVLIPFWVYNVFGNAEHGRKIFMGDAGSLTLGFILSFLIVQLSHPVGNYDPSEGILLVGVSTMFIPLIDVVRVVLSRLRDHRNPFLPDKNHIHHKLLRTGMRARYCMLTLLLLSVFFITLNMLLIPYINMTWLFVLDVACWIVTHLVINRFITRYQCLHPEKVYSRTYANKEEGATE